MAVDSLTFLFIVFKVIAEITETLSNFLSFNLKISSDLGSMDFSFQ